MCGETLQNAWTEEEAVAEANAAFTPDELVDAALVCDDCWQNMRYAVPELDQRYS